MRIFLYFLYGSIPKFYETKTENVYSFKVLQKIWSFPRLFNNYKNGTSEKIRNIPNIQKNKNLFQKTWVIFD